MLGSPRLTDNFQGDVMGAGRKRKTIKMKRIKGERRVARKLAAQKLLKKK